VHDRSCSVCSSSALGCAWAEIVAGLEEVFIGHWQERLWSGLQNRAFLPWLPGYGLADEFISAQLQPNFSSVSFPAVGFRLEYV
jgi:hypothetical protein